MGLQITWVSTTSHSFSGMMVDLGEALLPWPSMCALLLRMDLTTTLAGGGFLGLCAFWRQSRLEDGPLQECSMPPGFATPLNACCMFKLGDAWVYTNLAGSAHENIRRMISEFLNLTRFVAWTHGLWRWYIKQPQIGNRPGTGCVDAGPCDPAENLLHGQLHGGWIDIRPGAHCVDAGP